MHVVGGREENMANEHKQRSRLKHRRGYSARDWASIDARHAARRIRMPTGRPAASAGWAAKQHAGALFEDAMAWYAEQGWTASQVWRAATGCSSAPPNRVSASQIIAIAETAHCEGEPGTHTPELRTDPLWAHGVRSALGAEYDDAMCGLNVHNWACDLATPV